MALATNSSRNFARSSATGQAQASPKAQIVLPAMLSATFFRMSGILLRAAAREHAVGDLLHPERAFAARRALAARFVSVKFVDVIQRLDHVARVVHDDDAAGARHGTRRRERIEIHRDIFERRSPCP